MRFFREISAAVSYTHLDVYKRQAIIYAIIGLVVNTISALSVKELPEEELNEGEVKNDNEKYGMVQAFKPVSYTHLLAKWREYVTNLLYTITI